MPDPARERPSRNPDRALEEVLSQPTAEVIAAARDLAGDVLVLGGSGKMGPSLLRLLHRARGEAGTAGRVIGAARFSVPGVRQALERDGIRTVTCDLLDPAALAALPDAPHVVLMAGQKFGSTADPAATWATNVLLPGLVAQRFAAARLVAFSTGNVYPLTPVGGGGSAETDPVGPEGEYAQSALGRERVLTHLAGRNGTPMALLRINYAVEPRYGVLRDIANRVRRREPIALAMGHVNVIWQRDANAIAIRAFAYCAVPPIVLNVTGTDVVSVRDLATRFGRRFGSAPVFVGTERPTALLSHAARCRALFGPPPVGLDEMIDRVAAWIESGGRSLDKPTHYEEREGRF